MTLVERVMIATNRITSNNGAWSPYRLWGILEVMIRLIPLLVVLNAAAAAVTRTSDELSVTLPHNVTLTWALVGDQVLGLRRAAVADHQLTSAETVRFPLIADEWAPHRGIYPFFALDRVEELPSGGVRLHARLLGGDDQALWAAYHELAPDIERARREAWSDDLITKEAAAEAARTRRDAAVETHPKIIAAREQLAAGDAKQRDKRERALDKLRTTTAAAWLDDPANANDRAAIATFTAASRAAGLTVGRLHRDYYRHAVTRLPADVATVEARRAVIAAHAATATVVGTVAWTVEPDQHVIAGWPWQGWRETLDIQMQDGRTADTVRWLGSWEVGGDAAGVTVVNFRYRGLGGIEHTIAAGAAGATTAFTTTEILPGAVGGAPVISPAIPDGTDVSERGFGLRHRSGAWIHKPARGAGIGFVDMQWRLNGDRTSALFAAFPIRQGNLRALTEIFPGDRVLSHSDEEWFASTSAVTTTAMRYLVCAAEPGFTAPEARTRWLEVDQQVRADVAAELGFVRHEARPAVGMNIDHAFANHVRTLGTRMEEFAALGIKDVFVHHPGWQNGRDREPGQGSGGGDCAIRDWVPLTSVQEPWRQVQREAARLDMGYHVWLTGMNHRVGPFYQELGADLSHWVINAPGDTQSSGYPPDLWNLNITHPPTRDLLLARLDAAKRMYGYQGFWADSFQNLFMSMRDWHHGAGQPLQRAWWDIIAQWTRDGLAWTSESHAFPGLSCSIESDSDPAANWSYYIDTVRWWRVGFPNEGTPDADVLAFRFAAARGWAAPQVAYGKRAEASIPSIACIAAEYEAARPLMRRFWHLGDDHGALWLGHADDATGVWFAFSAAALPSGVRAEPVGGGDAVDQVQAMHVYRVTATDLLAAFGQRRGPVVDERIGRPPWQDPAFARPEFAAKETQP